MVANTITLDQLKEQVERQTAELTKVVYYAENGNQQRIDDREYQFSKGHLHGLRIELAQLKCLDNQDGFYQGVLFACAVMKTCGEETSALQLVSEIGGIFHLEAARDRTETEQDAETVEWLRGLGVE